MNRIASIDIFRALTMFFMIFVNDLWTLTGVPKWLLHTEMHEDGMGFSDLVFPVFLVIVGLSIPHAIQNRISKGDGIIQVLSHIGERVFALVCMGFFMVNFEYLQVSFPKGLAAVYLVICFFLIWNAYPKDFKLAEGLKFIGIAGLAGFASWYPENLKPHWWGILGLIGWSYLWAALAYVITKNNVSKIIFVTLFFLAISVFNVRGYFQDLGGIRNYIWIVESGGLPFLCMLGVLASVLYQKYIGTPYAVRLAFIGAGLIILGFIIRPWGGISKILATPAWVCICGGIGLILYAGLYLLVDVHKKDSWSRVLTPAGVATLTCYLIPYIWYAGRGISGITLPSFLLEYPQGLVASMAMALCVIGITGILVRLGIKLKV